MSPYPNPFPTLAFFKMCAAEQWVDWISSHPPPKNEAEYPIIWCRLRMRRITLDAMKNVKGGGGRLNGERRSVRCTFSLTSSVKCFFLMSYRNKRMQLCLLKRDGHKVNCGKDAPMKCCHSLLTSFAVKPVCSEVCSW